MRKQVKYRKKKALYLSIYADINVSLEISEYVYPNVYSCESSFCLEGMETIQFHHKKPNKHTKRVILVKLTKNMTKNSLRTRN